MKKLLNKIGSVLKKVALSVSEGTKKLNSKIYNSKVVKSYMASTFHKTHAMLWDKYPLLMQAPLAMFVCFCMEWGSRHSFVAAWGFVTNHTGAYLFNSYCIFAVYSLVFISRRQIFWRFLVTILFTVLGATNSIILLNRVSPFGYTDLYMISDLLTMTNSKYLTANQVVLIFIAIGIALLILLVMLVKGPKAEKRKPLWARLLVGLGLMVSIYPTTLFLREEGILTSYFGNLSQGYLDYGYLYGFSTSVFDRGMSRPFGYSEKQIKNILDHDSAEVAKLSAAYEAARLENADGDEDAEVVAYVSASEAATPENPNIVVILMESFYDVSECKFLKTSEDPIPYVHYLEDNYSSGYCIVPVVGAGTCNSEFEVTTGLSCSFFGPGEYPQKTILKETDVESYADVLGELGYGSHVVHNNGGNFYSRANAFTMMGFDTFVSKELLDITDYTPLKNWPTDDILIEGTKDCMDSTEGADFVYTITVQAHGNYPTYKVEDDPAITVETEGKSEEQKWAWEYYVNRIHGADQFVQKYVESFEEREEPTLVILFGDHLPTMGLTEDEVAAGSLYKTKYFTWNNFGMEKKDQDLTTYQLVAEYLNRLNIRNGNINAYHQAAMAEGKQYGTSEYMNGLETLQYDIMYGNRYTYKDGTAYEPSDLVMGINDVVIDRAYFFNGKLHIYGDNFTKWSKVYVNGEKVSTGYESGQVISINASAVTNGDTIVVNQLGSSNTIFRSSNEFVVYDPSYVEDVELEDESTEEVEEVLD